MKVHYSYDTQEERAAVLLSVGVIMRMLHRKWTLKDGEPKPDGRRHLYIISKTARSDRETTAE